MAKKKAKRKKPPAKKRSTKKKTKRSKQPAKKSGKGYPITTRPDRDRRVRQNARVARVLSVLNLIQSRGRWSRKAIAEELECSVRTVTRDLEVLEFAGVPWFQDRDQTIRVRPDFRFPVLTLTEDELLGQAVATSLTKARGLNVSQGARPTTRKLAATSSEQTQQLLEDASRLIEVLDLKIADHSRHHDALKTVQSALLRQRQLTGHYESPYEPAPVKLRIHPFRLCLIKNAWYVIGRPVDETEPRTYRVARFKSLRMLEETAEIPGDFDLQAYFGNAWSVYRGEQSYDVEIWFTPEAARVATETVWHHSQKPTFHKDGSVTLKFHVDGLQEIVNWVLSWAGRARVIRPDELRGLVIDKLTTALKFHQE